MTSGSSRRTSQPPATVIETHAFGLRDALALIILLALALLMMSRSGSRRGVELMPWPDGLEYAAQAVNLDAGHGAVLHFGGYSYPSRYPEGYPLILAAALPILGHDVARLYGVTIVLGLGAIAAIYLLALRLFGRTSATIAAALLALCPVFVTYSTLVLSDVPTFAATLFAAYALAIATENEGPSDKIITFYAAWAVFGSLAGFSAIMRPTNAMIAGAVAIALIAVRPKDLGVRQAAIGAALFVVTFAIMPMIQMHSNTVHLGDALASGYGWWVPEIYSPSGYPFSVAHLFGPTMPRNPHGNVPVYVTALLGLDGMLGDQGDPRYFLYPFAAAAFAIVGIGAAVHDPNDRLVRRLVYFGLALLGLLFAVYIFDLFTETAYLLPGLFIVFITAGYGAVVANRWMRSTFGASRRSVAQTAVAVGVGVLDLLLVIALATELSIRLSAEPRESETVQSLQQIEARLPPGATVVSNISLQFLQLYLPGDSRKFVGLNSRDPGESFTDYHLNRLFAKRGLGWNGPIPPVLFTEDSMAPKVAATLTNDAHGSAGVFVLLGAPQTPDYASLLHDEMDKIAAAFALEPVIQNRSIALFQLSLHEP